MKKKLSVALVTTLQPATHYSRYLIEALESVNGEPTLLIYADKDPKNKLLSYTNLNLVWTPNLLFPFQITKKALADRPDVVHIQHEFSMYGGPQTAILFPCLLFFLWLARIRTVVTIHAVVPKDEIGPEFMQAFSLPQSRLLALSVRLGFSIVYGSIPRLASRVIVHSKNMADLLTDHYGASSEKVSIIPIGVPNSAVGTREAMVWISKFNGKKIILYFGYIIRRKGLEFLIDAFERMHVEFPEYILILAGGELEYQRNYASELRNDVSRRGLDGCIFFTSFISEENIQDLFARCEFVVLPYIYSISSSLPLSFAMQLGKPVIATNLGTLAEEVEDGVNGLLVPPRDAVALAGAMQQLMADSDLLQRLAEGAYCKGQQRSWRATAQRTIQIYRLAENVLAA